MVLSIQMDKLFLLKWEAIICSLMLINFILVKISNLIKACLILQKLITELIVLMKL